MGLISEGSVVRIPTRVQTGCGPTESLLQSLPIVRSVELKRPGREADQSVPFSADVKNEWSTASKTCTGTASLSINLLSN